MFRFLWVIEPLAKHKAPNSKGTLNQFSPSLYLRIWDIETFQIPNLPSGCPGAFGTSRPAPAEPGVPQIPGQSKVFAHFQCTRRFRTFQPHHSSNQSPRPSQTSNTYIPLHVIEVGFPPVHPQLLHQATVPLTGGASNRASRFGAPKRGD